MYQQLLLFVFMFLSQTTLGYRYHIPITRIFPRNNIIVSNEYASLCSIRSYNKLDASSSDESFSTNNLFRKFIASMVSIAICNISPFNSVASDTVAAFRPLVYSVEMTDPPCLIPRTQVGETSLIERFSKSKALVFGYHDHISEDDIKLTEKLITRIKQNSKFKRTISVGVDFLDSNKQSILDDYMSKRIDDTTDDSLRSSLIKKISDEEWSLLKSFFVFAQNNDLKLISVSPPSTTISKILNGGFDALSQEERDIWISDPQKFIESVTSPGFRKYTEKIISSEYIKLSESKIIDTDVSQEKYFQARIFDDESIANAASKYLMKNNDRELFILLCNNNKVKFGFGVEERLKRLSNSIDNEVLSVLLNPNAEESLSYSNQLNLALEYGDALEVQRPLADFIWFESRPQMKLLPRVKNPISREGDKPEGESSVLGVFR